MGLMVTLRVQTFIKAKTDKEYEEKLDALIEKLERYGSVDIEDESEE